MKIKFYLVLFICYFFSFQSNGMMFERALEKASHSISKSNMISGLVKRGGQPSIFRRNIHARNSLFSECPLKGVPKSLKGNSFLKYSSCFEKDENYWRWYTLMAGVGVGVIVSSQPVFANEASKDTKKENPEETLEKIKLSIQKTEMHISTQEIKKKSTILIGGTAAGKTVVYNYLTGVPLEALEYKGKLVIDRKFNKDQEEGRISHGYCSETRYLHIKGEYCDSPGFRGTNFEEETPDTIQDIVNAYSFHLLFKHVEEFRLVLVVPETHFDTTSDRGKLFIDLIKQLEAIFPGQASHLKWGLTLLVTGNTNKRNPEKAVKSKISEMLLQRKNLTSFQREILEFFVSEEDASRDGCMTDCSELSHISQREKRITFFDKPTEPMDIPQGQSLVESSTYIKRLAPPKISVEAETKLFIRGLTDSITQETLAIFSSFLAHWENKAMALVKNHSGHAFLLRNRFREATDYLNHVRNLPSSFDEDINNIEQVLARFDPDEHKRFSNLMERYKFLQSIQIENFGNEIDFKAGGHLMNVIDTIRLFASNPEVISISDELRVKGCIVGVSDIDRNSSSLVLTGSKALLVDTDLHIREVKGNTNVVFMAPLWSVNGKRTFVLKGKEGGFISPFKAGNGQSPSSAGENGQPGKPGYNGGNFFGIADHIERETDLTVNLNGGDGGAGQQGGDGVDGESGKEGSLEEVKARLSSLVIKRVAILRGYRVTYTSGSSGTEGGNAGQGGIGGAPGEAGIFEIRDHNFNKKVTLMHVIQEKGNEGLSGEAGKAGRGGLNGHIFTGVYEEKTDNGKNVGILAATMAAAGTGAGIGAKVGGTVEIGTGGSSLGTITVSSTLIGGIVGGSVGFGSALYHYYYGNGDRWYEKPYALPYVQYQPNGRVPDSLEVNLNGRKFPPQNVPVDLYKMFTDYKNTSGVH
ncbi:MAG: hypothetical protein JSS34_01400 [Proteobacteria bacterium]|nr:hypothetical protein [Pseudomonadota bacterium]